MEKVKYLIIYHSEDNDGLISGALCKYYLTHMLNVDEHSIDTEGHTYASLSALYDDPAEWYSLKSEYDSIIMTDISFNDYKAMSELYGAFGSKFVWIDHHAPIIKESLKHDFREANGIRDINNSAIVNVWRYLYDELSIKWDNDECPAIYRILSAWDSWTFKSAGFSKMYTMEINTAVTDKIELVFENAYEFVKKIEDFYYMSSFEEFHNWEKEMIDVLWEYGKVACEHDMIKSKSIVSQFGDSSFTLKGNSRKCVVLFTQGATNSMMFNNARCDNGIVFKRINSGQWIMSMYNSKDDDTFDCGEYCKANYKGGGHKGAAGATLSEQQMSKILKEKKI